MPSREKILTEERMGGRGGPAGLQDTSWEATGTQVRDDVLRLCTESFEDWLSQPRGQRRPEGGVLTKVSGKRNS